MSEGQAAAPVDGGVTQPHLLFVLQGKLPDGPRGADLAAEGAAELAVTDPRHQHRCPEPFESGLQESGLEPPGDAHLHALPAAHAALEKGRLPE